MGYWKWYEDRDIRKRVKAVHDLVAVGYSQTRIAETLHCSQATVSGDVERLKQIVLYRMGTDSVLPYVLDLLGLKTFQKQINEAFKELDEEAEVRVALKEWLRHRREARGS